ncbi:MAG: Mur ligase family protein, partial [Hyphomicrobium sp.]
MTAIADPLWTFDDLVAATGAVVDGAPSGGIGGVSIDTRTIQPGDLFVALTDVRDGHEFVTAAFGNGAAAALVASGYAMKPGDGVLLRVARARLAPDARVIAVTGSAGKTTTKEMLRACCARLGATHASEKSYNNHWGVPLTLARMPAATRYAIFEIGMNHAGEITPLTRMVAPHVAVVTTVVSAHLEHFGTEEAIADAKAEIFRGLAPGGVAIMDFDNRHFQRLRDAALARPGVKVTPFSGRAVGDDEVMDPARTGYGIVQLRHAHEVDGQSLITAHGQSYVLGAAGA